MNDGQFKVIVLAVILLFLICFMNMCNSCSTSRKVDQVLSKQDQAKVSADSIATKHETTTGIQLQLMQPQIVNQFLDIFNSEKYKNQIDLNQAKIDALNLQLKNEQLKNDTTKKRR